MSFELYKIIHIFGALSLFVALGGYVVSAAKKESPPKLLAAIHGISLILLLVAGFGLMARLAISHTGAWPLWIWLKLGIWLALGAITVLFKRARNLWFMGLLLSLFLGLLAVSSAVLKFT